MSLQVDSRFCCAAWFASKYQEVLLAYALLSEISISLSLDLNLLPSCWLTFLPIHEVSHSDIFFPDPKFPIFEVFHFHNRYIRIFWVVSNSADRGDSFHRRGLNNMLIFYLISVDDEPGCAWCYGVRRWAMGIDWWGCMGAEVRIAISLVDHHHSHKWGMSCGPSAISPHCVISQAQSLLLQSSPTHKRNPNLNSIRQMLSQCPVHGCPSEKAQLSFVYLSQLQAGFPRCFESPCCEFLQWWWCHAPHWCVFLQF